MEKTKEEVIADLYALRGGLSVISNHTDKIRKQDESIEKFGEKLKEVEWDYEADKKELTKNQIELDRLYKLRESSQNYIQSKKSEALKEQKQAEDNIRQSVNKCKRRMFIFIIITLISIITSVILLTLSNHLDISEGGEICESLGGFLVGLSIVFLVISIVFLLNFIKERNLRSNSFIPIHYNTGSVENQLLEINKNIGVQENHINKLKINCSDEQAAIQVYKNAIEKAAKEKEEVLSSVSFVCQNIKQALNATYDNWLSESDWQNVDLLIYYLETGRADTLKEALSMVDRQLQTNQIVNAISMASTTICEKIDSSMRKLSGALTQSFAVISQQLSAVSGKMDRIIDISQKNAENYEKLQNQHIQVVGQLGEQIKELQSAQLEATEMNRALLEKANRSSKELMDDLRYGQRYWVK